MNNGMKGCAVYQFKRLGTCSRVYVTLNKIFSQYKMAYTEKNATTFFFKVSDCNQFILDTFK